ncbi:uncharacterized protein [Taeniopygia guttata]|uniref:uncharacterized protein isoform X4 n=1 Tax=Taeniopygia guttata TaxID=59729 RepID=UPI001BC8BF78|nr:uncharacterized protein LOC116807788 isoform X3 [Taeniopygia guttata]
MTEVSRCHRERRHRGSCGRYPPAGPRNSCDTAGCSSAPVHPRVRRSAASSTERGGRSLRPPCSCRASGSCARSGENPLGSGSEAGSERMVLQNSKSVRSANTVAGVLRMEDLQRMLSGQRLTPGLRDCMEIPLEQGHSVRMSHRGSVLGAGGKERGQSADPDFSYRLHTSSPFGYPCATKSPGTDSAALSPFGYLEKATTAGASSVSSPLPSRSF